MDKRIIAVIGIGIIGAVAYILLGPSSTSEGGASAGGGGSSKKEADATEPIVTFTETTETTEPLTVGTPTYNISLPTVVFPALPQPYIVTPWWVTSPTPPAEGGSKKASQTQAAALEILQTAPPTQYVREHPISTSITTTLVKAGVMKPTFATQLLGYK